MITDIRVHSHTEYEMGVSLDTQMWDVRTGRVGTTAGLVTVTKAEGAYENTWLVKGTLPAITAYLMDHVASDFDEVIKLLANAYVVEDD